jgi:hypothetical protein
MQAKIITLLKEAFPISSISGTGTLVTIRDDNTESYLIFEDDLVFRSGPGSSVSDLVDNINNFFTKHKKEPGSKIWYLSARTDICGPKNKELWLNFSSFKLENEKVFYKAFPPIEPFLAYKKGDWNCLNCTGFVTSTLLFAGVLIPRARFYWIDKMVLIFRSNLYSDQYYLNEKEGVGYHLLEMMIKIYGSYFDFLIDSLRSGY